MIGAIYAFVKIVIQNSLELNFRQIKKLQFYEKIISQFVLEIKSNEKTVFPK